MKKTLLTLLVCLALAASAYADNLEPPKRGFVRETTVFQIFDGETVTAGSTATSDAIDISGAVGYFSIQVAVTGSGTASFEYLLSLDGADFFEPSSASDIATGVTVTSGPGSDGKEIYSFSPELAKYLKIKITETGTSDSVTADVFLGVQ